MDLSYRLHLLAGEKMRALQALEEASALSRATGDLARAAKLMSSQAEDYLLVDSKRAVALRVEASSILRGLSDRMRLHELLLGQVFDEFRTGSIPVARERWAEAKAELQAAGEPVTPYAWLTAGWLEFFAGDARTARERYSRARETPPRNLWATTSDLLPSLESYDNPAVFEQDYLVVLELALLTAEDRVAESRSVALARRARVQEANLRQEVAFADRVLCILDCEEGRPGSERCGEILKAFPADQSQCLLEAGKPDLAARTAQRGLQEEPSDPMLRASLAAADLMRGQPGGLAELKSVSADLRERGSLTRALRVELLLGRIEVSLKKPDGRQRLKVVAEQARSGGLMRLARRAREAATVAHPRPATPFPDP